MDRTIVVRFVCDILWWDWSDLELSHKFPILAPFSVNRIPEYYLISSFGTMASTVKDFDSLSPLQQKGLVVSCIKHKGITWKKVLEQLAPNIKDPRFVVEMIAHQKEAARSQEDSQQFHYQYPQQRPNKQAKVTPEKKKSPAVPDSIDTDPIRVLFETYLQNNGTSPTYGDTYQPDPPPLNNTQGNISRDIHWVQQHLESYREENWICTRGVGSRSFIDNPTKAVHTLFNWHNKRITASDVQAIEYINSLREPMMLAESIQSTCHERGITLTRGRKNFADVFSCQEPADNLILIVGVAKVHTHEKDQCGIPKEENFTVLLLLHQK